MNGIPYIADAYADKKWAFVSDYARLYVVHEHGGIYLDTDVLLHSGLDDLLRYDCWLASDDVRYINTGIGFGSVKGHPLIGVMKEAYCTYSYPSGTNVIRDTKIIERQLPHWVKSDRNQVIDHILLIGVNDYGKYAKHLYTYTWADESTRKKREKELTDGRKNRLGMRLLWKIKCFFRSPSLITFFDKKRGTKLERAYTFFAYDFLDYGPVHYFKLLISKLKR